MSEKNIKYYRQVFSKDDWAIGLESDDTEYLTRRFWSFWNWKATSGKLDWWTDKFAVFWTDEARFEQAVLEICRIRVMQDLGADSLDTVELVMALEEEFDTEIPDEEAEKITTVQLAIDYINKNLG